MAILKAIGGNAFRVNLYPTSYVKGLPSGKANWSHPLPETLDAVLSASLEAGLDSPYLILEYYATMIDTLGLGDYSQFRTIGKAFASYAGPGGTWARAHNASASFGIRHYTWANEPDGTDFDKGGKLGPEPYRMALQGLSDGVKSVDSSLLVLGGGLKTPNMGGGGSLRGIGASLQPLWANGSLDAIDLHTYNGPKYAPLNKTYGWSANQDFEAVVSYNGVNRTAGASPLQFIATELNYKSEVTGEDVATRGLFTCLVDNAGVIAPPRVSGAPAGLGVPTTAVIFPWNLFHTPGSDSNYGMAYSLSPYKPT